jgi:hypothetical protein
MQTSLLRIAKGYALPLAVTLITLGLFVTGCSSSGNNNTITTATTSVPVGITDAPADPILAVKMTINSIVLTDTAGKTASILKNPAPFEAVHMDAVQEPFVIPPIPQDTYASVAITISNATVAYIDPTTSKVDVATATLVNNPFTYTFTTPVTVGTTHVPLLLDFLVAKSVTISGSTVTVSPNFTVVPAPVAATPTNGTNGLMKGYKGQITAISTSPEDFTVTDGNGNTQVIYVSPNSCTSGCTTYQDDHGQTLSGGFSALAVNALVEVDTVTQSDGTLLAVRVEVHDPGTNPAQLLLGPVTLVTPGSPASATSFTMLVRQQLGKGTVSATPVASDTITVTGATKFLAPPRFTALAVALPFTYSFDATTIFAGQHVAVVTTSAGVSSNAATAAAILLQPQTISGVFQSSISVGSGYTKYVLTLSSTSWLAKLTGETTINVYTNNQIVPLTTSAATPATPVAGTTVMRFNGFLFNNSTTSTLELLAGLQADPPGTPIAPHM